ncbi:cyclophilin-like fold protein [Pollutibacter soli]|uniref:cyclophilin-like fold protein n=1 Tax=Pollutibacter soli TaxID=3034157 RepID=UPI003013C334
MKINFRKHLLFIVVATTAFMFCHAGCYKNDQTETYINNDNGNPNDSTLSKMKITIGSAVFIVSLNDNPTVRKFKSMLPLTIEMSELNANEKFFYFSSTLPTDSAPAGTIMAGDLMLYGNNCLVLFYENLNSSYSYTRLGKIENVTGLKKVLGTGKIIVKFELQ